MKKVFLITINLLIVFNTNTCCFRPKPKIHPKDDIVNIAKNIAAQFEERRKIESRNRKEFEDREKYAEERATLLARSAIKIRSAKINPDLFKPKKSAFFDKVME